MKSLFLSAVFFSVPCVTVPVSAALVALPEIVITEIGQAGGQSGVRTDPDLGAFSVADSPIGFFAGDEIVVTIRAAEGMRFQLEGDSTLARFSLAYGSSLGGSFGTAIGTALSSFEVDYGGLSGGSAPNLILDAFSSAYTVTPNGNARAGGFSFDLTGSGGVSIPDTITFDSITLRGFAAASMDSRWPTDDRFPFSSVPTEFNFYVRDGGFSMVPVPEPTTAALFGLAGTLAFVRRRRGDGPRGSRL